MESSLQTPSLMSTRTFCKFLVSVPNNLPKLTNGASLSPGPADLHMWMKTQGGGGDATTFDNLAVEKLQMYNAFPAYLTSFVVAADITIAVSRSPYLHLL